MDIPQHSSETPLIGTPKADFSAVPHTSVWGHLSMSDCKNSKKSGSRHALGGCIFPKAAHCRPQPLPQRTNRQRQGEPAGPHLRRCKTTKKVECAIFRRGIPHPVSGIAHYADNAPGRASEATATILAPKYRKNGASAFQRHIRTVFRQFLPGNWETSDFLRANIRGFASKVRRFVAKKSDVFGAFPPFFRPFFAVFCRFQRQKCPETMVNDYSDLHYFDIHALQNAIILPFFRAGRDAGHCQNF